MYFFFGIILFFLFFYLVILRFFLNKCIMLFYFSFFFWQWTQLLLNKDTSWKKWKCSVRKKSNLMIAFTILLPCVLLTLCFVVNKVKEHSWLLLFYGQINTQRISEGKTTKFVIRSKCDLFDTKKRGNFEETINNELVMFFVQTKATGYWTWNGITKVQSLILEIFFVKILCLVPFWWRNRH